MDWLTKNTFSGVEMGHENKETPTITTATQSFQPLQYLPEQNVFKCVFCAYSNRIETFAVAHVEVNHPKFAIPYPDEPNWEYPPDNRQQQGPSPFLACLACAYKPLDDADRLLHIDRAHKNDRGSLLCPYCVFESFEFDAWKTHLVMKECEADEEKWAKRGTKKRVSTGKEVIDKRMRRLEPPGEDRSIDEVDSVMESSPSPREKPKTVELRRKVQEILRKRDSIISAFNDLGR